MVAVDLCTFNYGLGIYIRILSLASARDKKSNLNAQPMVKWAQIYGCHELFLKCTAIWMYMKSIEQTYLKHGVIIYLCKMCRLQILIIWPVYCLFFNIRILITPLVSLSSSWPIWSKTKRAFDVRRYSVTFKYSEIDVQNWLRWSLCSSLHKLCPTSLSATAA
jgi:hypothetical protein